ncbi:hypothetical protein DFH28DRAFT_878113 [Melampsora americana]|nr:hypothetical protein DFH28DRAFT_878113 [Melampsora americana]
MDSNIEAESKNRTIKICDYIKMVGMNPKEFIQNLLDSEVPGIPSRRQYWSTLTGWDSTEKLILSIKKRVIESERKDGTDRWNAFILKEAHEIVNREEPPRGNAPKGSFHSAENVDYNFFESQSEHL